MLIQVENPNDEEDSLLVFFFLKLLNEGEFAGL